MDFAPDYSYDKNYQLLRQMMQLFGWCKVSSKVCPSVNDMITTIENHIKYSLFFPTPYPYMYGVKSCKGIIGDRAIWGLYCAYC